MTRGEKIAKAATLRGQGQTYEEIARAMGVSKTTARRWLNPDAAEADRAACRAYKARNRESIRARDREYHRTHKGRCPRCGGEMSRCTERAGGMCAACHRDDADHRARLIEQLWAEGWSRREIADRLGSTDGAIGRLIFKLRDRGYDLPYRGRHGRKHPEQVPA